MKNEEVKNEEIQDAQSEEKKVLPKMREIIIKTDGNRAEIVKAEVAGVFELIGILESVIKAHSNK